MYVEQFLTYSEKARGFSAKSLRHYSIIINSSLRQINKPVNEITRDDILQFIYYLNSIELKNVTIKNYIAILRTFFDYLCTFHNFQQNPTLGIQRIKVPKLLPLYVPRTTMDKLLNEMPENSFKQIRTKTIIMTLYQTGMRASELCTLHEFDIDFFNKSIRIFGKGSKERLVPLSRPLSDMIQKYMKKKNEENLFFPESHLFGSIQGTSLSYMMLLEIVKQSLHNVVPPKMRHPHILRHTFATVCLQSGMPIQHISALLGHVSVETTMRYLSLSNKTINNQFMEVFK